jgi:hypothetical protein
VICGTIRLTVYIAPMGEIEQEQQPLYPTSDSVRKANSESIIKADRALKKSRASARRSEKIVRSYRGTERAALDLVQAQREQRQAAKKASAEKKKRHKEALAYVRSYQGKTKPRQKPSSQ